MKMRQLNLVQSLLTTFGGEFIENEKLEAERACEIKVSPMRAAPTLERVTADMSWAAYAGDFLECPPAEFPERLPESAVYSMDGDIEGELVRALVALRGTPEAPTLFVQIVEWED